MPLCVYFSHEVKFGSNWARKTKRARTNNTKYFKAPFTFGEYNENLQNQNPELWKQYQDADDTWKCTFFDFVFPAKETLHS